MSLKRGSFRRTSEPKEQYTKMLFDTMQTPAWRALSSTAQALYVWLKLEWRSDTYNNNGRIRLSCRQAAEKLGVSRNTAMRAFHDLQAKGFIVVTEAARLGTDGDASSPYYELTELAPPHAEKPVGRKLYRDWRPGADFTVVKVMANNPFGTNGRKRAKPCHRIGDETSSKRGRSSREPALN